MKASPDESRTIDGRAGHWSAAAEIVLIFVVFFLLAGWPAPDVNEAHYLAKAKHYWDPDWCADDHFLQSADAHLVFYWCFGWVTLLLPLPAAAWVGRLLTWALLAWAWQRLSYAVVPCQLGGLLSAGIFLSLLLHTHMAGEWVVGGVEAKGFSYVLVLLALEALVRGRWNRVWLLLGTASSFHVLVGGWSVVAAGIAWLLGKEDRPRFRTMGLAIFAGGILSLPGLLPALWLNVDASAATVRQANQIYVFQRLSHHMVLHQMQWTFVVRHLALLAVWIGLCLTTRPDTGQWRLRCFVVGAVAIAIIGGVIALLTIGHSAVAASLLRYYWFRLSDVMLPLGTALTVVAAIARLRKARPVMGDWCLVVAMLAPMLILGAQVFHRRQDIRPGSAIQSGVSHQQDWRQVCDWIAGSTRADDCFLTPRRQQTFKWYAGRSKVVTWKDIPQDAQGIVQWYARYRDVFTQNGKTHRDHPRGSLAELTSQQLRQLAGRYNFQYIVLDRTRRDENGAEPLLALERVYPNRFEQNKSYAVVRMPR